MASFGDNLRRERELRGASVRDIAEATKISTRFLEALEQDRLDVLPGGIYPRAFVRQYARYLGLDADRLVAEFVYAHPGQAAPRPAPVPETRPVWPRVVAVVGVLGALSALWLIGPPRPEVSRRPAPPSVARTEPSPPPPRPDAGHEAPSVYEPASETEDTAQVEGLVLTLRAEQECWVGVEADGRVVLNRVLAVGESETLRADAELVLSVGNAGGITFSVNDRPGVSLGHSGEVRRNIVITRQSLPTLVEEDAIRGS